jgi:hypothetical protein
VPPYTNRVCGTDASAPLLDPEPLAPEDPEPLAPEEPELVAPEEPELLTPEEPELLTPDEPEPLTPDEPEPLPPLDPLDELPPGAPPPGELELLQAASKTETTPTPVTRVLMLAKVPALCGGRREGAATGNSRTALQWRP